MVPSLLLLQIHKENPNFTGQTSRVDRVGRNGERERARSGEKRTGRKKKGRGLDRRTVTSESEARHQDSWC